MSSDGLRDEPAVRPTPEVGHRMTVRARWAGSVAGLARAGMTGERHASPTSIGTRNGRIAIDAND
jgi:hypothetical protein